MSEVLWTSTSPLDHVEREQANANSSTTEWRHHFVWNNNCKSTASNIDNNYELIRRRRRKEMKNGSMESERIFLSIAICIQTRLQNPTKYGSMNLWTTMDDARYSSLYKSPLYKFDGAIQPWQTAISHFVTFWWSRFVVVVVIAVTTRFWLFLIVVDYHKEDGISAPQYTQYLTFLSFLFCKII